jgi:hypothetical protein
MRFRSVILAGILLLSLAPVALADNDHGRGRGRDRDDNRAAATSESASILLASGGAAAGASDPKVVVTLPGGSSASAAVVCASQPGAWATIRNTAWVSPIGNCGADQAAGQYRYDVTFSVPSGATNLSLSGSFLVDDTLSTLQLNGHALSLSSGGNFTRTSTFATSDQSFFTTGTNTLSFFVNNAAGPTGLDFRARIRTSAVDDDEDDDNRGQCVSEVARDNDGGPGHGEEVREAAQDCD